MEQKSGFQREWVNALDQASEGNMSTLTDADDAFAAQKALKAGLTRFAKLVP
jgi:hypothetical protein